MPFSSAPLASPDPAAADAPAVGRAFVRLGALLAMTGLAACAARMDVREVGAGGAPSFYELRGQRLGPLRDEAARRCPKGFRVARAWERARPAESGSGPIAKARTLVEDFLWPGAEDQAQLTIQCDQGLPVFEPRGLPLTAALTPPAMPVAIESPQVQAVPAPSAPASAIPLPRILPTPPVSPNANKGGGAAKPGAKDPKPRKGAAAPSPFSVPAGDGGRGAM